VFPIALGLAGGWPAARLVLFGANAALRAMLHAQRVPETVPVAEDLPAACALLHQRPTQARRHRDLLMHISAPAAARSSSAKAARSGRSLKTSENVPNQWSMS
jgi:hypothetical protein